MTPVDLGWPTPDPKHLAWADAMVTTYDEPDPEED